MNKDQNELTNQSESPSDIFGDDWQTLQQDWQQQPYKKSDVEKLLKQSKRRTLWAKGILVLDILATLFLVVMSVIGLLAGDWGTAVMSYLIIGSLLSIVFVYYEFKIRLGAWKKACDSPDRAIVNAVQGCTSSIRYIKLIKFSCWVMFLLFNLFAVAFSQESGKPIWPLVVELNFMILSCYLITHWFHRKRKAELERLQQWLSK